MEAVTIAGLAVVAVGGYFSVQDFLNEAGITGRVKRFREKASLVSGRGNVAPQSRIKKVAGMYV
jgi:hypothetical protein